MQLKSNNTILALDVGEKRIGVAEANAVARIAHPLTTLSRNDNSVQEILDLIQEHDAAVLVIGLPRGMSGQETAQTAAVQAFGEEISAECPVPVHWQDEAVTSHKAEAELEARRKPYAKEEVDALAATYILEDFLQEHPEVRA